jgi:hypothetical protein
MRELEWTDLFRLLFVVAMAYGAYQGFKRMGTPLRYNGKRYYPGPNGAFYNAWGILVRNPAIIGELAKMLPARAEKCPPG